MEIDLLTYLISNDFVNLKKVRKFIDNKLINKFLDFEVTLEDDKKENYKFCNYQFEKGKFKGTYCFAKTFNSYTDKCKIHNKEYKLYKENNLQEMNQFMDGVSNYYDLTYDLKNKENISNMKNVNNNNLNILESIIGNIESKIDTQLQPSAPKIEEIIEINDYLPFYEEKQSMFNNNIVKIGRKRKSKKKKNKKKNNIINDNKIYTNEIININNYFKKLNTELKYFENKNINKETLESDVIYEFNTNELLKNKEIADFINKYQFLNPIRKENDLSYISNLESYQNKLNEIDLSQYQDFKGYKVYNLTKNIIDYQLRLYYLYRYNNTNLSNTFINFINSFLSRIPK